VKKANVKRKAAQWAEKTKKDNDNWKKNKEQSTKISTGKINISYADLMLLENEPGKFFAKHWGDFSVNIQNHWDFDTKSDRFLKYLQSVIANNQYGINVSKLKRFVADKLGLRIRGVN